MVDTHNELSRLRMAHGSVLAELRILKDEIRDRINRIQTLENRLADIEQAEHELRKHSENG